MLLNDKRCDLLKKCVLCIEKNDFFGLDELLKSKTAFEVQEDPYFTECEVIFAQKKLMRMSKSTAINCDSDLLDAHSCYHQGYERESEE